jgi:spore maturation protein CgeB
VDPTIYKPAAVIEKYRCDLSYLGTYAEDRQPKLMSLLDGAAELFVDGSFIVAGAQYPDQITWAPNVQRMTHVYPPDHPSFYSSSSFTLNLTREDMVAAGYSPSVRLFEASACGAAILSDRWEGLDDFLTPGEEVLLPQDAYEVTEILRNFSAKERRRLGARARDRILAEHTSLHRARQFEEIVSTSSTKIAAANPSALRTSESTSLAVLP